MDIEIQLQPRNACGIVRYYPYCDKAKLLAGLRQGKKVKLPVFNQDDVNRLKKVGLKIKLVPWLPEGIEDVSEEVEDA